MTLLALERTNFFLWRVPKRSQSRRSYWRHTSVRQRVGLSVLNSELRYLAINDTLAAMNGLPAADHLGKTVREVLGDFADIAEPNLRRLLATGEPVRFEISTKLPHRTHSGHWILHYLPIRDETGTVNRICAVVVEITVQKTAGRIAEGCRRKTAQGNGAVCRCCWT